MSEEQLNEVKFSDEAIQFINKLAAACVEKGDREPELGFRDTKSVYVFLNNKGVPGYVWFTRKDNINTGIPFKEFKGHIKGLVLVGAVRKNKDVPKLRLLMTGEDKEAHTFEIGYGTNTAKCVISALAVLTPKQVKLPVTIQPYQSKEEESVVFVSVTCEGERVDTRYDAASDWEAKLAQAQANINPEQ